MPIEHAFDPDIVAAVAADYGHAPASLDALLARHQATVRENPGVESLVYELRKYHPDEELLARTDDWFVCAVRETVWEEFAVALDADVTALEAVHKRQARALELSVDLPEEGDGRSVMCLQRA